MSDMSIVKIVEAYKRFSNYGISPIVQQALDCTSYSVNWNQLSSDKERSEVSGLAAEYGYRCERVADLYLLNGKSRFKTRRAIEKERARYL